MTTEVGGERLVVVGELSGAHGVRGEMRLRVFNPDTTTPDRVPELFLLETPPRQVRLRSARRHGRGWLVTIDGVADPETARMLTACPVAVREADLAPLGGSEYYHYQLVGLEVFDESGRSRGRIREVLPAPASDVLVVEDGAREHLLPFVSAFVNEVDLAAGRIVVRSLEGLFED